MAIPAPGIALGAERVIARGIVGGESGGGRPDRVKGRCRTADVVGALLDLAIGIDDEAIGLYGDAAGVTGPQRVAKREAARSGTSQQRPPRPARMIRFSNVPSGALRS